jgi:hypothetical protein
MECWKKTTAGTETSESMYRMKKIARHPAMTARDGKGSRSTGRHSRYDGHRTESSNGNEKQQHHNCRNDSENNAAPIAITAIFIPM